jgi:putative ABC transport system permease protein
MRASLPPLLAPLRHNPTGALLVTAQIAITLAVLCNTVSIVAHAVARIELPPGFDTRDTFLMSVEGVSQQFNVASAERADLEYLRGLHDVAAATITTGEPLTNNGTFTDLTRNADASGAAVSTSEISLDEQGLRALDVPLVAGRGFRADEITSDTGGPQHGSAIIVTESLARALFPDGHALGATVYEYANQPLTIIGIARDFMGPEQGEPSYRVCIVPQLPGTYGFYHLLVRALPGRRDAVIRAAQRHIVAAHPDGGVAFTQTLTDAQRQFTASGRNMAFFLSAVTALMLAVCGLGVFGLTAFNVSSRTRQIGIRRAVGARRRDIVAHFLSESALILGSGAVLGTVLALALGQWLSDHFGEPRLDLACILAGIVTLCAIGQLAAWHPARRAASVPPSIATRTV